MKWSRRRLIAGADEGILLRASKDVCRVAEDGGAKFWVGRLLRSGHPLSGPIPGRPIAPAPGAEFVAKVHDLAREWTEKQATG